MTPIDRLYAEFKELLDALHKANEITLANVAEENFRKSLLLAAASYFEYILCDTVLECLRCYAKSHPIAINVIKNKAVSRQYHTWFVWDRLKAGPLFGMFGDEFKIHCEKLLKDDPNNLSIMEAFIEIGGDRNRLVHQNYATFALEKTMDEIYQRYQSGVAFPPLFTVWFRQFCGSTC